MTGHDPRCEWSPTPPARCRCSCNGVEHGVKRVREQVLSDEAEENEQ